MGGKREKRRGRKLRGCKWKEKEREGENMKTRMREKTWERGTVERKR